MGYAERPLRVLIVDDNEVARASVAAVLGGEEDITVVGQCSDGTQVIDTARAVAPDVVIMDLAMPIVGGVQATRELLAEQPGIRVLVFTTTYGAELAAALAAGACGYLLRGAPPEVLLLAVRALRILPETGA
jgi:DNA-binding NarL/FixJ family response regulator